MKKSKDKDVEIINQIKEGDTSSFRLLVDKYKDVSFSLACSILRNEQEAEDALQESLIKAYNGLKNFRFQSSFATWLYKIVVNTCNSKYKSQQRHQHIIKTDSYENYDIPDDNSVIEDLIILERKSHVNHVLDLIKQEESLMLRLFYLADLSIEEIKQITGYKDSKIKVTLFRARKSFQKEFEKIDNKN